MFDLGNRIKDTYSPSLWGAVCYDGWVVPKIIHQVWLGPLKPPTDMMDTFKIPGWEYVLWTEREVCARSWNAAWEYYYDHQIWWGVKDSMMPAVLSEFGGVFVDVDCVRLGDWSDPWFMDSGGFAARTEPHSGEPNRLGVGTVGGAPGNKTIERWKGLVDGATVFDPPWQCMVPLLSRAYCEAQDPNFLMLPQGVFYPVGLAGNVDDTVEPFTTHFWATTRGLYER